MAMSKKLQKEIAGNINSLLTFHSMVNDDIAKKDYDSAEKSMSWFNDAADKLIAIGIPVIRYGHSFDPKRLDI
jgi:hypothetical protein